MGTYIPTQIPFPTGLDEIGIHLGYSRLDGETLYNFQRRLILETRERTGPTQYEFFRSITRRIGEFDIPVFRLELILDGDGNPVAPDPFVEVTSNYFRAYGDYSSGIPEIELSFMDRANGYFLRDLYTALSASAYFIVVIIDDDYTYKQSRNLRFCNTDVHVPSELLLPSVENKLKFENLKSFYPKNKVAFLTEKDTIDDVLIEGDYYVDYPNGVVFSFSVQGSFAAYTYSDFPFTLFWQIVRVYPYLDTDKKYSLYDTLISDTTGEVEYTNLNSDGAWIANRALSVHPLEWGE